VNYENNFQKSDVAMLAISTKCRLNDKRTSDLKANCVTYPPKVLFQKVARSTGAAHTSTKARLTSVVIRM